MRVITGKARGIQLKTPDGMVTRPTADRVKEALFSIIQFDIPGARVLDLFGGTGQLGIEALSRGAKHEVFVDANDRACRLIQENLKMVDLAIEVIDGRIPVSSRNPIIDDLVKSKKRIIILNKSDLADQKANDEWAEHFKSEGEVSKIFSVRRKMHV